MLNSSARERAGEPDGNRQPAAIKSQLTIERPYPRHRDDPYLVDLRRQIMGLLGLGESW
ncbi:hypothetical protein [Pseudomonas sp. LB3P25]